MNNLEVRLKVLVLTAQSLERALNRNEWRWMGHVMRVPTERSPRHASFCKADNSRTMGRRGQSMTYEKN